ncbi:MAG: hypothetical protein M3Y87_30990, partial [Myxococcota bacterium]|nr:hypothetical protein [Myxococcota bacterium]
MRRASLLALRWSVLLAATLAACLELPPPPAPRDAAVAIDAPEPPRILAITVLDASDRAWNEDAIPRSPRVSITASAPIGGDPEPVMLLAGDGDDALLEDLAGAPLRASTAARSIACERVVDGARIELRPLA